MNLNPFRICYRPLARSSLAAGLLLAAASAAAATEPQVFGWIEEVTLDPNRGLKLTAKLDTGADTSSLDARNIRRVRSGDQRYVRFLVTDPATGDAVELRKPFVRRVRIKRHSGEHETRMVVRMRLCLGGHSRLVEVNLVDRGRFEYPLLLGRSALDGIAVVDPAQRLTAEPNCWGEPGLMLSDERSFDTSTSEAHREPGYRIPGLLAPGAVRAPDGVASAGEAAGASMAEPAAQSASAAESAGSEELPAGMRREPSVPGTAAQATDAPPAGADESGGVVVSGAPEIGPAAASASDQTAKPAPAVEANATPLPATIEEAAEPTQGPSTATSPIPESAADPDALERAAVAGPEPVRGARVAREPALILVATDSREEPVPVEPDSGVPDRVVGTDVVGADEGPEGPEQTGVQAGSDAAPVGAEECEQPEAGAVSAAEPELEGASAPAPPAGLEQAGPCARSLEVPNEEGSIDVERDSDQDDDVEPEP